MMVWFVCVVYMRSAVFCHVMTKKCEQDTKIVINILIILAPYLCFKAISGIVPNSTTVEGFAIAVILLLK